MKPALSVCCMTGGFNLERLGAILELFRDVADEIVVAVDDRRLDNVAALAGATDRVLTFPFLEPGDRPIPWLFQQCNGRWILNVDDDEIPSPRLIAELPDLVRRDDMTHAWIARRWLYPDPTRYLDEAPWAREYQLRLVLSDSRFLQFSDEFHRPVICSGPARFVDAPLWHLDTAINDRNRREAKALAYEQARRGMRIGSLSHNTGLYVPELRGDVATAPVPEADLRWIHDVLAPSHDDHVPDGPPRIEGATRGEIDRAWPGEPVAGNLCHGRVTALEHPPFLTAGVQQTIDVEVENLSDTAWRWGDQAVPEIRLSYRIVAEAGGQEMFGLRTALPHDLPPGQKLIVPMHVATPHEPGRYRVEIDLVHEHVRWFGCVATVAVDVRARYRVAVAGSREPAGEVLDRLVSRPEVEPVRLRPDGELERRFGLPQIPGLRTFLLGPEGTFGWATIVFRSFNVIRGSRKGAATARSPAETQQFVSQLGECVGLVVAGHDWADEAPQSREWWRLGVTMLAARRMGLGVFVVEGTLRSPTRARDRALRRLFRRYATSVSLDEVATAIAEPLR